MPSTKSSLRTCPVMDRIDSKTIRILKDVGGLGLKVRQDRKTKEPVFYVWQMFTFIRLDVRQARELIEEIGLDIAKHDTRELNNKAKERLAIKLPRRRSPPSRVTRAIKKLSLVTES